MLKQILDLDGAQKLTTKEQKSINGAGGCIRTFYFTMTQQECADEGGTFIAPNRCRVRENICV